MNERKHHTTAHWKFHLPSVPLTAEELRRVDEEFLADEIRLRDGSAPDSLDWQVHNRIVERMQAKLTQPLFSDRADEIIPTKAEEQILERRLAEISELDGTYPSPVIYGGDIVEIIPQAGDGEVPF